MPKAELGHEERIQPKAKEGPATQPNSMSLTCLGIDNAEGNPGCDRPDPSQKIYSHGSTSSYRRSSPQFGQKFLLFLRNVPHLGQVFVQSLLDAMISCFPDRRFLAIVVKPTARMAPKARPKSTEVFIISLISMFDDSPNMKSVKATVDTIPAAPIPTSGCLM